MPDPTLSNAIKEAYASAPVGQVIYHTLELWHSSFSLPIRVVRDFTPLSARLEATAARDPGAVVTFVGYAFDVVPPDQTTQGIPQCSIVIDNVDREIIAQIDLATTSTTPITVIYRTFLSNRLDLGPENIPPLEMSAQTISATPMQITAAAGFPNLLNRKFPAVEYELDTFPGLAL